MENNHDVCKWKLSLNYHMEKNHQVCMWNLSCYYHGKEPSTYCYEQVDVCISCSFSQIFYVVMIRARAGKIRLRSTGRLMNRYDIHIRNILLENK